MKLAFVGKGGAGKSSITGTVARILGARGESVVVLDTDPMPGLAYSIGVAQSDAGVPEEAFEQYVAAGHLQQRLRLDLDAEDALARYSQLAPDGVRFLPLGKTRGDRRQGGVRQQAYLDFVSRLTTTDRHIIGDLPGGTRQPFFGWADFADIVVVVVEPTPASMLSGQRLARLSGMSSKPRVLAVVNKTRATTDVQMVAQKTGLPVIGAVGFDPQMEAADRLGLALIDFDDRAPAVLDVDDVVSALLDEEVRT